MALMSLLTGSTSVIDQQVITDIGTLLQTVTGWLTTNAILKIFLTVTIAGIGIGFFRGLKRAV